MLPMAGLPMAGTLLGQPSLPAQWPPIREHAQFAASAGSEPQLCSGILELLSSSRPLHEAGKDAGGPSPCTLLQSNLSETALG
jgi:hypothetical protein